VKHGGRLHFSLLLRIVYRWCHLSSPLALTRLLYIKVRKSSRSPHAPFPYVSKPGYSSSQLKQRPPDPPLLSSLTLPIHLAYPVVTVAPLNATDEPKCASGRVRAGVGRRCSRCHGVTLITLVSRISQGSQFHKPQPLELWGSHFKSSEGGCYRRCRCCVLDLQSAQLRGSRARLHSEAVEEPKSFDSRIQ
jgi:hypothetical protein